MSRSGEACDAVERAFEEGEALGGVVVGEVQGRQPAHHFGTGRHDEEAVLEEFRGEPDGDWFARGLDSGEGVQARFVEFEANHHAEGADGGEEGMLPSGDGVGDVAAKSGRAGGQGIAQDDTQRGEAGGADEGAAAVGGAVGAGAEEVSEIADVADGTGDGEVAHPEGTER